VHARLTRACGAPWRGSDGDARIDVARAGDKLTTLKRAWGEACFEAYGSGDDARVRQHWTQTRREQRTRIAEDPGEQTSLGVSSTLWNAAYGSKVSSREIAVFIQKSDTSLKARLLHSRRQLDETLATIQKKQSELDALKVLGTAQHTFHTRSQGAPSTGATPTGAAPTGPTPVVARPVTQVAVRVPPGAQPGQPLTVVIPNGGSVQAVVPAGCAPGQVFYVEAA